MIEDPVRAELVVSAFALWGLLAGLIGFFIGKSLGFTVGREEGLAEGRREENLHRVLRETTRPRARNIAGARQIPWWVR